MNIEGDGCLLYSQLDVACLTVCDKQQMVCVCLTSLVVDSVVQPMSCDLISLLLHEVCLSVCLLGSHWLYKRRVTNRHIALLNNTPHLRCPSNVFDMRVSP